MWKGLSKVYSRIKGQSKNRRNWTLRELLVESGLKNLAAKAKKENKVYRKGVALWQKHLLNYKEDFEHFETEKVSRM